MTIRKDFSIITNWVPSGSKVLDLGCDNGELLLKIKEKGCMVRGIEQDFDLTLQAISKNIPVFLGDIDRGLDLYEDDFFDIIILSSTIQQIYHPGQTLSKILRKGKKMIVSFANYGYYLNRLSYFFRGEKPVNSVYRYDWFNTVDIHPLTIKDFYRFCRLRNLQIEKKVFLNGNWTYQTKFLPNLLSGYGIFLISR